MKTNITLKVDADLVRDDCAYEAAQRRALARLEEGYDLGWTKPSSRDELHER